jgi:rRNA-processing protein FCF1
VPDGWWRDRPAAAARLVSRLRAAGLPYDVVVVLEGAARSGVAEGQVDGVRILHAPGSGDDMLVALAAEADAPVQLVSADRELGKRARDTGAQVVGPGWLLDQLP